MGGPLPEWASEQVAAILVEKLGVSPEEESLFDLRSERFQAEGTAWLTTSAFDLRPVTAQLVHSDEGFFLTLYPQQGAQVTSRQRRARQRAQEALDTVWRALAAAPAPDPRVLQALQGLKGPRLRASSLAERQATSSSPAS